MAAANNGLSTTIIPPCRVASLEEELRAPHGARPSVRLCVGPELARCVHKMHYVGTIFIMKMNSNDKILCDNIVNKKHINVLK